MGILDELKKEARQARKEQQTEAERRARLEAFYDSVMRPRMLGILNYLHEMIEQLEVIGMRIPVSYELPGVGQVHDLLQQGYRVNVDSRERPQKVGLLFDCAADKEAVYRLKPMDKADEFRDFLEKNRAPFMEMPLRDDQRIVGASFQTKIRVAVRMLLQADIESQRLVVISSNLEGLKTARFSFGFDYLDDGWMDQLGHYILRKDTRLGSFDVSDTYRNQLQAQLAAEQQRRCKELSAADSPVEETGLSDSGFFDQVRKVLTTPIGRTRN